MAGYVFMRYLTRKKQEMEEMEYSCRALVAYGDVPVGDIVRYFVPKRYHIILVMDETGDIAGFTTEMEVVKSFFELGIDTPLHALSVTDIMPVRIEKPVLAFLTYPIWESLVEHGEGQSLPYYF